MSGPIDKDTVLSLLRELAPRAVRHGEVCSRLGVDKTERDAVLDALEELASLDLAKELPGRRFRAGWVVVRGVCPGWRCALGGFATGGAGGRPRRRAGPKGPAYSPRSATYRSRSTQRHE